MNKQGIRSVVVVMALVSSASAGTATILSTVQQDFTIEYERANGQPQTENLAKGASAPGNRSIQVPDRGTTAVTVKDAAGTVVATGKVADNVDYVLLPKGDGFVLAAAGTVSGPWTPYPGVVIYNTLPDSYQIDLFGTSGKVGLKNVKLGKALDVKAVIKIPPGDDRFNVVIHLPDGTTQELRSGVSLGWYHVIHKTYDDKVTVSALGWIENPDKKTKKK